MVNKYKHRNGQITVISRNKNIINPKNICYTAELCVLILHTLIESTDVDINNEIHMPCGNFEEEGPYNNDITSYK